LIISQLSVFIKRVRALGLAGLLGGGGSDVREEEKWAWAGIGGFGRGNAGIRLTFRPTFK